MPDPYTARIQQQRQRIKRNKGDDSDLRQRLNQLRSKRFGFKQQNQFNETPWNAQYETSVGQANRDLQFDQQNFAAQEQMLNKSFGFNDPSDPFSRARQIKENFDNARRGTLNNYAAGGQLYSGALTNARDIDRKNFEQSWDAAQKDYQSQLSDLALRRLQSQMGYEDDVLAAEADRLEGAIAEPVDPAEAPRRPRFKSRNTKQSQSSRNQGQNRNQPNRNRRRR